jgi:Kef-type K+ transport system membrane component KefB
VKLSRKVGRAICEYICIKGSTGMDPRKEYFWNVLSPPVWITLCLVALAFTLLCCGLAFIFHWTLLYYTPKNSFSLVWFIVVCFSLSCIGLTNIAMGLKKVRTTHIPWYMQKYMMQGIAGVAFVAMYPLLSLNSVVNSNAIDIVVVVCTVLIVAIYIWSFIVPTKKYRRQEGEQAKGS